MDLTLKPLLIRSRRDLRLVTATIGSLVRLSSLNVGLASDDYVSWEYSLTILYSCPPSVRKFCVFTGIIFRGSRIKEWEYDYEEEEDVIEDNRNKGAEETREIKSNEYEQGSEEGKEGEGEDLEKQEEVNVAHIDETEEEYDEAEDEYSGSDEEEYREEECYSEDDEEYSEDEDEDSWDEGNEDTEEEGEDIDFDSDGFFYSDMDDSGSDRDMDSLPEIPRRASPLVNLCYLNP